MVNREWMAVSLTALLAAAGCSSSNGGGGATSGCGGTDKGCVSGTIYADSNGSNGAAVSQASVTVDGTEVTKANEQGWFFANGVRSGDSVPICFSATNMVKRCRTIRLRTGQSLLLSDTRLMAMRSAATRTGDDYQDSTGAQITLPDAKACVSGAAASGVTCRLTPIDANSQVQRALAPGNFTGRTTAGSSVNLETGGMLDIHCTDGSGNAVNVCSGQTVAVRIPIASNCANATTFPDTMNTWAFSETTGVWNQDGPDLNKTCNGDSGYYAGTVSHFSYWNADMPLSTTCLNGRVTNNGRVIDGALIRCEGTTYNGSSEAYTSADGTFCVAVKAGGGYSCIAAKGGFVSTVQTGTAPGAAAACGSSTCATLATDFALVDPLLRIVLSWGANPPDLDSHTVGPNNVHVYYSSQGSLIDAPFIGLDTDDTSSYGPEITTFVPGVTAGKYRFCVYNYSGESSGPIAASAAVVQVFTGTQYKQYQVPTSNPNGHPIWRVFQATVNADNTVSISDVNDLVADTGDQAAACAAGM